MHDVLECFLDYGSMILDNGRYVIDRIGDLHLFDETTVGKPP